MSETEYGDEPGGSGVISAEDVKDLSDEQKKPLFDLIRKELKSGIKHSLDPVSDNYDEVAGTSHPIRLPPSKKDIGFLSMVLQKPKDAVIALGIDPHASIKDEDGPERRKAGLFAEYWMKEEEAEKIVEAVLSDLGKSREEITSYIEANKSK